MCMCSDRYFRHDIHASLDLKLRRLMAAHGAEGYGIYWLTLELLSQLSADEGKEPRMQLDPKLIAKLLHSRKPTMIESVVRDFELFVVEAGDDNIEYFYSRRLSHDFHEAVIRKGYEDEEPSDEPTAYRSKRRLSPEARERMAKGGRKYRPTKVESKVEEGTEEGTEEGSTKVKEGTEEGTSKVDQGKSKVESKVDTKVEEGRSKVGSKVKEGTTKVESKVEEGSEEGSTKVDAQKSKVDGGIIGGQSPKTIRQEDIKREGEKATRFSPPSLDEVRAEIERAGYEVDPERFIAHYESNGWRVGPNKMKSWKSALVTWHKRQKEEDAKRQSLFSRASQSRPTYTNAEYHPERSAPPTPQDDMAKWLALDHDNRAVLKRNFPEKYANYPD